MDKQRNEGREHFAIAKALNLPISTKQSVEISNSLRYKTTSYAKKFLEEVIAEKRAVPFLRFKHDIGHRAGMAAGRFPQKAAKQFLQLIKSAEANAQVKGLDTSSLKITKILANKASLPFTGGRLRQGTKRSHLEVEVKELASKKGEKKNIKVGEQKEKERNEVPKGATKEVSPPKTDLPKASSVSSSVSTVSSTSPVSTVTESHLKKEFPQKELSIPVHHSETKPVEVRPAEAKPAQRKWEEPSSAELLRQVQARAAEFNKKEKFKEDVSKVESLYEELRKKGTLRKDKK